MHDQAATFKVKSNPIHVESERTAAPQPSRSALPQRVRPLRVLLVVESTGGGTGRHVLDLAEGLAARGQDVHLIYSPVRMDRIFASRLSRLRSTKLIALPMQSKIHPDDFTAVRAIRRYIKSRGPFDVVHGHSSKGGAIARLAAVGTGCPAVYTPHGLVFTDPSVRWPKRILYLGIEIGLSSLTRAVITVAPEEQRAAIRAGMGAGRVRLVPNGLQDIPPTSRAEARRSIGLSKDDFAFGFVGRLVDAKAPDLLLKAFALAAQAAPNARLVMVGGGPLVLPLRQLANELGVAEKVLWLGERDAQDLYPAFDVFTISSRKEGLPYVVLEAMAAGLPVVASASAGVELLVETGVNGTVLPRDNCKAFANAMIALATDPGKLARYGHAARRRSSLFTVDAMVDATLDAYATAATRAKDRQEPMHIELIRGEPARRLLSQEHFAGEWSSLNERCPWATSFQSHGFARAWYSTYVGEFEPLLVCSRAADGSLQGLLTLAISKQDGSLISAGREQAEYHTWICLPELADRFPLQAMRALRREMPKARLTFHYLAPGTPIRWLGARDARRLCLTRPHRRPLLQFGDGTEIAQSLRKGSNKSRLKRLDKLGGLEFRRVMAPAEFESLFDQIIRLYDFRHGAVQGSAPFCRLERQKAFHVAMMKEPGLLHVTVMKVGGKMAAAHFGVRSRKELQLGTIVHDPMLAKHSPGKFQLLLLSKMLIEEGMEQFDLTPGGDAYKERFTNAADEVLTLSILPSPLARTVALVEMQAKVLIKQALKRMNMTPVQAKFLLRRLRQPASVASTLLRRARNWFAGRNAICVYQRGVHRPPVKPDDSVTVRKNALEDLLLYDPGRLGESRQAFLSSALFRLEAGQHVYTTVRDGRLCQSAWLDERPGEELLKVSLPGLALPPDGVLVHDLRDFTDGSAGSHSAQILRAILHDLAAQRDERQVFFVAPADDAAAEEAADSLAFTEACTLVQTTRLGQSGWCVIHTCASLLPARPTTADDALEDMEVATAG